MALEGAGPQPPTPLLVKRLFPPTGPTPVCSLRLAPCRRPGAVSKLRVCTPFSPQWPLWPGLVPCLYEPRPPAVPDCWFAATPGFSGLWLQLLLSDPSLSWGLREPPLSPLSPALPFRGSLPILLPSSTCWYPGMFDVFGGHPGVSPAEVSPDAHPAAQPPGPQPPESCPTVPVTCGHEQTLLSSSQSLPPGSPCAPHAWGSTRQATACAAWPGPALGPAPLLPS